MLTDVAVLEEFARGQHGVFALRQSRLAGISDDAVDRLVSSGVVSRVYPAVLAFRVVPPSRNQATAAACLATDGLLFGRCAAGDWALRGSKQGKIELLLPHTRYLEVDGVTVHRTRRLDPIDVVDRGDGIRVTSPARTLLDYAAYVGWERFESAAFDAIQKGLLTHADLAEVAIRLGGKGRRGIALPRAFLDANDPDAGLPESELEVRMLRLLRSAGITGYRPQLVVEQFRLDFPFPDALLDVEVDGREFHTNPQDVRRDRARDRALKRLGWRVLRFTWFDVVYRPDWVVAEIRRELTAAARRAA